MLVDRARLLAAAVAAAVAFAATEPSAEAFCRTTTERPAELAGDDLPCAPAGGVPLFHKGQCFAYRLTKENEIPNAVLSDQLARAFGVWVAPNPTCVPGILPIELAPDPGDVKAEYVVGSGGRNLVGVARTWRGDEESGASHFAFSTVTFKADTGEILDVDLELRPGVAWSFGGPPPAEKIDLQSVLIHEVGHILGFAHTNLGDTAMDPVYRPDRPLTSISGDERAGICAVYPNRGQRLAASGLVPSEPCQLVPGNPAAGCGDPDLVNGCTLGAVGQTSIPWASAAGTAGSALLLLARRRKRSPTAKTPPLG